ncbi:MAG: cardiolipin synthase [Methanoregula sp.]|nr:cardiolipin synthase [Methanoregula sp.]
MLLQEIFTIIVVLNICFIISLVFFERRNPTAVLAWLSILIFLPVVGFVLYLILGQNYTREQLFTLKKKEDETLLALISEQKKKFSDKTATPDDVLLRPFKSMVLMLLENNWAYLTTDNRVWIYTDGNDKFSALLTAIQGAKEHINLEYYIIRNDHLGKEIVAALAERARAGITVRLLVDGLGCGKLPRNFFAEYEAAGGKLAKFFPSRIPFINLRMNFRNHRKIAVIDGTTGFVGGFNIGDEYLGKDPKFGHWRDTHLKIEGTAAHALQIRFFLDWNFATGEYVGYDACYYPAPLLPGTISIQVVSSGPDARWNQIKEAYLKLIHTAKKSVYIQTPYFVPDESVMDALRIAALSGVDVRIMFPNRPDHPFVYWTSYSYIGELLDAGVKAYTYENGFIHAKTVVVDGIAGSVGSANWDVRSFRLNFETNAFVYDRHVCGELHEIFLQDIADSRELTPERYAQRSRTIKFKESVCRLFSPLL